MALWRSRVRVPLGPLQHLENRRVLIINQSGTAEPLSSLNERGFFVIWSLPFYETWQGLVVIQWTIFSSKWKSHPFMAN